MASDVLDHIDELSSSVSSLQALFDCPICLDMLRDPVRTSCGHTFCRMCIKRALRKLTKQPCPNCKTLLSYNKQNVFEDDTMSVFMGLVIELISSINADIGFDVTSYNPKPVSSYEASLNSEEFLNMKSNKIVAQNVSDVLMTSKSPSPEPITSVTEHNFGAFKENVERSRNKITDHMKSSSGAVGKRDQVENKLKLEDKIPVFVENVTEKASSSTEQVTLSTSKEDIKNLKEICKRTDRTSSLTLLKIDGEFNFLKPKSIFKRKYTSSIDCGEGEISKSVAATNDDKKVEENKKKKMKVSVEEEKENKKKNMKISVEEEKVEDEERKLKISFEEREDMKMMSIPGPSHCVQGSANRYNAKYSLWRDDKNTSSIKTKPSGMRKKSSLKKTVPTKMTKPLKTVARKSTKFAAKSTFIPKRLNDKTSKFYFTTSLVIEKPGQRPVSLMKRKYIVPAESSSSDGGNLYTCSNTTVEASNQSSDSAAQKSFTSVSVQTSPIKCNIIVPQNSVKKLPAVKMERVKNSANIGGAMVNSKCLESKKFILLKLGSSATIVRKKDIENATTVRESKIENDSAKDEPLDQTKVTPTNIASQEEMDIFEPPATEEGIFEKKLEEEKQDSQKMKTNSDEKVDEPDECDSDLTQVNPYIKNRNNVCTRRTVTPTSARCVGCSGSCSGRKTRCMSARKLVKQKTDKSNTLLKPSYKENEVEKATMNDEIKTSSVGNDEITLSTGEIQIQKRSVNESPHVQKMTADESSQGQISTVDDGFGQINTVDDSVEQMSTEEKILWKQNNDKRRKRTNKSTQKQNSSAGNETPRRRKLRTNQSSENRLSKTDSNTPQSKTDKNSSSPFLNSAGKMQKSTENSAEERDLKKSSYETPRRQKLETNQNSEDKFSKKDFNTPQPNTGNNILNSGSKKHMFAGKSCTPKLKTIEKVNFSSTSLNSVRKKLIPTENTISEKVSTESNVEIPISEQLKKIIIICKRKGADHEVMNINGNVSNVVEERAPNESQVDRRLSRGSSGQFSQVHGVISSSDDFKFSQLTGQSLGNSQGRNMTQMDTAFCGSDTSERMVTQQEQLSGTKESPIIVIDGSDDEEIPQTPNKTRESEILTQHNTSKLDRSMSDRSLIPSSLDVSQIATTSTTVQKFTRSSKKQSLKENEPNSSAGAGLMLQNPNEEIEAEPKKYSFVYSRLAPHLLEMLKEFAKKINATITSNITEDTTHIILAPQNDNRAIITYKFLKGIALRLWVVSFDWVWKSLEKDEIQPEVLFLTLDPAGEPGPRRCKFEEHKPLSNYIIVPKPPYGAINEEQLKELIVLCGGTLVEKVEDLPEFQANTPRILLTDEEMELHIFESLVVNDLIIPLHVDWLIDCIGAYKVANVSQHLHHRIEGPEVLLYLGLSDELIQDDSESEYDEE